MSLTNALAQRILDRVDNGVPKFSLAVFLTLDKNNVLMTKPTTALFAKAMEDAPDRFVGVYNKDALEVWIADDLSYAGMR